MVLFSQYEFIARDLMNVVKVDYLDSAREEIWSRPMCVINIFICFILQCHF